MPFIGETLSCCRKTTNLHDPFDVKVRKTDEIVVWTKILADLVGNFCSRLFSESKRTESETSLAAIQHFVSDSSHVH